MALAVSSQNLDTDSDLVDECASNERSEDDSLVTISNIKWTINEAHAEEPEEIISVVADNLNQCEEGCHECFNAWMSNDIDNVYQTCVDYRPMKFGRPCGPLQDQSKCNRENDYCLHSYPYGDLDKYRSVDASCRSVPDSYLDHS